MNLSRTAQVLLFGAEFTCRSNLDATSHAAMTVTTIAGC
jgi:hypothetical protein